MMRHIQTVFMVSSLVAGGALLASGAPTESRARDWLDSPWRIRYVIFFGPSNGLDDAVASARKANRRKRTRNDELVYFHGIELFSQTVRINVPRHGDVGTMVVAFDHTGKVTSAHKAEGVLVGKRNMRDDLVLVSENAPLLKPFQLARWSQGIPGDVDFSPAVCNFVDMLRYEDDWNPDHFAGNFGCREWTAQLYDREQPYIDVTSYQPSGNYIGEFVGWSRFEDPPKPVIGKHGDTWVCLHECPGNEQPGVIPDIKKWAAKHKFPLPTRPDRQPLYPNSLYKDDLNEFDD